MTSEEREKKLAKDEAASREKATPGAQKQIDALDQRMRGWTKVLIFVMSLWIIGIGITGWQISEAFKNLEEERIDRIGAQSSINAYFCRQIDQVGNGVAALVAVSLADAPSREELTPTQQIGYDRFLGYLRKQRQPPRCHEIALKLAILTGADPEDVVITPLRLNRSDQAPPDRKMGKPER